MKHELEIIENFSQLRVVVVGESVLDIYLDGSTERICREAPVPVVNVTGRQAAPGGGANTARNLATLGAQVAFLSVIGSDAAGTELLALLAESNVDSSRVVVQNGRVTPAKHRVSAEGQLLVRFDQGDSDAISPDAEKRLCAHLAEIFAPADAIIISDYDLGVLTPGVIACLGRLQRHTPRLLVADARRLAPYCGLGVTAVKPNYEEACRFLELRAIEGDRAEIMRLHGARIVGLVEAQLAAITLDAEGAVILEKDRPAYRTYGRRVPASQAAGAGDTFVSGLTLALAAGAQTTMAAEIASAAAAAVVAKSGTSGCTRGELREHFAASGKAMTDAVLLRERIEQYRGQGRRIVFTNGCFDILHRGHVTYLSRAKAFGDVLIVGVNSDESVRRLKGPGRPINSLEDRTQVLAALSCIDHIVPFDADTASDLIAQIRPDVFVKGGDYAHAPLPEAPLVEAGGGHVVLLDYLADYSTTRIVERIAERHETVGEPDEARFNRNREVIAHGPQQLEPGAQSAVHPAR